MAGYLSPGAYFYAEEQEYLQAYEDVLERYKGRAAGRCRAGGAGRSPGRERAEGPRGARTALCCCGEKGDDWC